MTSPRSSGSGSRTALLVVMVLVVLLVIGLLSNNTRDANAYDPTSAGKTGTKAFVETIESFGASVDVPAHVPGNDADIAVMFVDPVPPDRRDDVLKWVQSGHTLVVMAPDSELAAPGASGSGPHNASQQVIDRRVCTLDALGGVDSLDRGNAPGFFDEFDVPPGAASCFGDGSTAFITSQAEGDGRIVSIAGGALFQNQNLPKESNAALATAIFAPHPGTRVAILTDAAFASDGSGTGGADTAMSLNHLITFGVWLAILQLGVGVVVYGLSRGRRLGRPVVEPQPVQIAGSELMNAIGNLFQQMKQPNRASSILRADLRRQLCTRIGLPLDADPDLIAATVSAQTDLDHDVVLQAVADAPVANDAELVALAAQIDNIRKEILHEHAT